ncbi:hypothetical protein BC833DRAFT_621087 [Globomyces pollinis-pini]|nr:hypothetical protein BC833DRAFT_621087 [Globomyces pollinis-pini]
MESQRTPTNSLTNNTLAADQEKNQVFTKELQSAIHKVIKAQNFKQPQDKICFMWLLQNNVKNPKLICFRKIQFKQQSELQMAFSENSSQFDDIIESVGRDRTNWENIKPPKVIESKLLLLLKTVDLDDQNETLSDYLTRIYKPHWNFWTRYVDSWSNGKSLAVLNKFGTLVVSGYPITLLNECSTKLQGWFKRISQ